MAPQLSIGMVGLDTSHCLAFTRILNDRRDEYHISGAEVIAAYPGGSASFSHSRNRVQGFTQQMGDEYGVQIYDDIATLAHHVDAILLESVDGRQHLEQFEQLAIGKPVYIDKPLATTTADAYALVDIAARTGTPIMSCSALRYAAGIADLGENTSILAGEAFGPAALLPDYPGLFWYGIHGAEILFSFMGAGCASARCIAYPDLDVVIGEWEDGRMGILHGTRIDDREFGCVLHTADGARYGVAASQPPYYYLLLRQVMPFFHTGVSPIDIRETLDIIAFLEAAEQSRADGGAPVVLAEAPES
ncbi:MAG: Gfo/Idh/MocA family protein [Anaerolineae bacterium]